MKLAQLRSLYKLIGRESRNMRKSVPKHPRQRASAFMLESLENRVLLSATPMDAPTAEPVVTATVVTTDKADYSPGETAVITTSNTSADGLKFGDGELVQFQVTRTDGIQDYAMGNLPWYVTDGVGGFEAYQEYDANGQAVDRNADGLADLIRPDNDGTVNGSISTNWFVEDQYLGASLQLTATGQTSGAVATTEFTDSSTATTSISSASVAFSSTTAFTLIVTNTSTNPGGQPTMGSIRIAIPAGMTLVGTPTIAAYDSAGSSSPVTWTYDSAASTSTLLSFKRIGPATNDIDRPAGHADITFSATATAFGNQTFTTSAWNNNTYGAAGSFTVVSPVVNVTAATPTVTLTAVDATYTGSAYATSNLTTTVKNGATDVSSFGTLSYVYYASNGTTVISAPTNAGSYFAKAVFTSNNSGYTNAESTLDAFVINQAVATVTVNGFTGIYDAAAHGASGIVVGVAGDVGAAGSSLTLGASFTNAPGGTANWSFEGGTNYTDQSGTAAIVINQAVATVTVNGFTGIYDAAAHGASGIVVGVAGDVGAAGSSLTLGASFTNAPGGTANWSFEGGTNYTDQSGTAAIVINQAVATVTVNGFTGIYDAAAHGASGIVVGVAGDVGAAGSSLTLGASFTNAPGGTANWSFEGGTNYTDQSGTAAIVINQAVATVTVNGFTGIYDAAAHGASGIVVGVAGDVGAAGSSLTLGASFTNAPGGTANWSFEGGTNYTDQSGTAAIVINQAVATVTVNGFTGIYDAAAHGASGIVVGVAGDVGAAGSSLTLGASFTNAPGGTANWSFEGGTNYTDQSGTAAIVINQAVATVTVNGFTGIYDAAAHGASGIVVGVAGDVGAAGSSLTLGASFTNAPGGTANWSFEGGTNYTDQSGTAAIVINQAVATVTVNGFTGIYDAAAHGASGIVVGVAGDVGAAGSSLTLGASFTNAPGGTANWSFEGGTNYTDQSGTAAIVINQAVATVTVNGFTGIYDAAAHGASGIVVGVAGDVGAAGSSLTLGASFTNAPGGTANWSFEGGTNYTDQSGTAAIVINQAVATVTVNGFTGIYDAAAHGASGIVVGVAGDVGAAGSSLTLGASFTNAPGGTANWSFEGGTNYTDQSGTAAIVINQAVATVTVNGFTGIYDAAAHGASGIVVGVAGDVGAAGSSLTLGASFTNAPGGTANWSFEGGTNYTDQSGTAAIVINQAVATVTVNGFTGIYDAAAHGASGIVVGVAGDVGAAGSSLTLGASFTNAPGGTANWSFEGGTNYTDQSGTAAIVINQANLTITVGSVTKTFGQTINLANIFGTTINTGINGETLAMSYNSAGEPVAALVGPYALNGTVVVGGTGSLSNYNVTINPGMLTVMTPSVITIVQDGVNLIIVGTGGCDTIAVNATNPSAITVNGVGSYSVGASGHVIVYGMACDDDISLTGNVNLEAHGGVGNDTITGGAGHDVIFGDTGNDTLTGAAGNDVLVGGAGSDRLVGSAGHDILVSGDLTGTHNGNAYDYDTLRLISNNWAAANASADPDLASPSDDVVDESGSADQLTGSSGRDWFIIGSTDKITDINSTTKDGDKISYS